LLAAELLQPISLSPSGARAEKFLSRIKTVSDLYPKSRFLRAAEAGFPKRMRDGLKKIQVLSLPEVIALSIVN
jgi:hypothetical protein